MLVAGAVDLLVLGVLVECVRVVLFLLPLESGPVLRSLGASLGRLRCLAEHPSALGLVARAVTNGASDDDRDVTVRESVQGLRSYVGNRLSLLRLMGPLASFVGLAGAAAQFSWMQADHGVLDLDPDRVLWMAAQTGALCVALGIAGSTTAIGSLHFLRGRARLLDQAVDRLAERLVDAPAWTAAPR